MFYVFVLGETARARPQMIDEICDIVHEIASRGYFHKDAPIHQYCLSKQNIIKGSQEPGFFEVPIAVFRYLRLPAGGGWFLRNFGVSFVKVATRLLLRRKMPVILDIHPLDLDSHIPELKGILFHVTRRCEEYVTKAMKHILQAFQCKKLPIVDLLEEYGFSFV